MGQKIKSIAVLVVGGLLAWWFISRLDWALVGVHLRNARIWPLVIAAILINVTMIARSLRWQAFLAPIADAGLRNLFAATSIGFGAIFVIGRAGEIVRPAVLSLRERLRPSVTFATIFVERIYDTVAVVLLFSINLLFFTFPPGSRGNVSQLEMIRLAGALLTAGVVIGIGLLFLLRIRARSILIFLEKRILHLAPRLVRPLINFIQHLTESLSVLMNIRELTVTVLYTVFVWATVLAASWISFIAFDVHFTLSQIIFTLGFGLVGSLVPTPGGSAGAYHAAAAKGLEFLGLEPNLAASIAIINHLIGFGPPFLLGLYFLIRDDLRISQIREMLTTEDLPHAKK
jgi:glycosyltransferase 2 family protein